MKKNIMMRIASVLLVAVLLSTCAISGTYAKYVTSVSGEDAARVAYWGFTGENTDVQIANLFDKVYAYDTNGKTGDSVDSDVDVIAPGTMNSATFKFEYTGYRNTNGTAAAPEVAYDFKVSVAGSDCDPLIQDNKNIKWSLDNQEAPAVLDAQGATIYEAGTWGALMTAILRLSGNNEVVYGNIEEATAHYAPGALPAAFNTPKTAEGDTSNQHTIAWNWIIGGGNATYDHDSNQETAALDQDQYDTYMANAAALDDVTIVIAITATQVD